MPDRLLLYLSHAGDPQRFAVGPTLAAAADRAGWRFDCYYGAPRRGRHFGGGPLAHAGPARATGGLVAGGLHAEQALWLATRFRVTALGDAGSPLWAALQTAGSEILLRSLDPAELYAAAFDHLQQPIPGSMAVVDAAPQGPHGVIAAPYLVPAFLGGDPVLGIEASAPEQVARVGALVGGRSAAGWFVAAERASALGLRADQLEGEVAGSTYAELTASLAERHRGWGRGVLLGDPDLVAAQTGRVLRDRLVPLYGLPQTDVIERAKELIRGARPPVYGRQYDDRDFFELAKLGHGLQVVDPAPPFASATTRGVPPDPVVDTLRAADAELDDATLREWAGEGRVLTTLLFWGGMLRELECVPRILDLVASTGVRAGIIVTAELLEEMPPSTLSLFGVPPDRGGVKGLLEPLLGSTGRAVAAEAAMPPGTLQASLQEARGAAQERLAGSEIRGWWPLLDCELVRQARPPVGRRGLRPVVRFTPRAAATSASQDVQPGRTLDARSLVGSVIRRFGLHGMFEERRPFDAYRPGAMDEDVAAAVAATGFDYMFTKSSFGEPTVACRKGRFVGLTLTAGEWGGWSPFYTVSATSELRKAERRLTRSRTPGWLVGTIDSPLWLMSGEILEHGTRIYDIAARLAEQELPGRLMNVTPNTIARYARLL